MAESSKAVPKEWVGRLFQRFRAIYGNRADVAYGTADADELLMVWAEELGRFDGIDIASAIETTKRIYREFPPTLPQFAELCADCRARRGQVAAKLDGPKQPAPAGTFEHLRHVLRRSNVPH